jgi:hypothetical protein
MRTITTLLCILLPLSGLFAQKMLVLERANRAKTTKLYPGEILHFRLAGKENYWYEREITDIMPETNTIFLDNFAVKLDSIVAIKVRRKPIFRIIGGALFTFGASLTVATTVGYLYNDRELAFGGLYGTAAGSMATGYFFLTKRTLNLGKKHRLRLIEIKFPTPDPPRT